MAYAERRERKKGTRYRAIYKAADGRYCVSIPPDSCARMPRWPSRTPR